MKSDARHIRQIKVVSNTHWDREFRRSFEKTRRHLMTMMDVTLDILDKDPAYHSFTMDGHSIMIDDYLELRPERTEQVKRLVSAGRLILGPWYTLPEQFSLSHETLVRNLMWGRKTVAKYGGKTGTVAYTPASWGQTGQLPQILADFGLDKMMFYRGFSHHEGDAEWIWQGADGTRVLASRFALFARYNWYYQVHRAVTRGGRVFEKDYVWGESDDVPFRFADSLAGEDLAFDLKDPAVAYDPSHLKKAIQDMVDREGPHFTTEVFLAMHGHDISVAHPLESRIVADAREALKGQFTIEHTDLESYWRELVKYLDQAALPVLAGERRSYLKEGKWTYLMPNTISARTYLKLQEFDAYTRLVHYAEPLASLAWSLGGEYPERFLERAWGYLLSNHTHDANGGVAPDPVCKDMEYRYRKVNDLSDIVLEDAMSHVAVGLSPKDLPADAMQLVVFNPLPMRRDAVVAVDLEVPRALNARSVQLAADGDALVPRQMIYREKSGSFVDSIWDVPSITDSDRVKFHAKFRDLPALGYRVYHVSPDAKELRPSDAMSATPPSMENEHLRVTANGNGTIDVLDKRTGRTYAGLNYLLDQGEAGNGWDHVDPRFDRRYTSQGVSAAVALVENGPLVSTLTAQYEMLVPADLADGFSRSERLVALPVRVEYRLEQGSDEVGVAITVDNRAKDHWLRVCFPSGVATETSVADSHFDVVSRRIELPDSTGWVEPARGTHPLRTFVDLSDGQGGMGVMPKGLFEYEVFEDVRRTLALTLLRACRIKLAVSEEKKTVLPDEGVQCPGERTFQYALAFHAGDWRSADMLGRAARYASPVRAAQTGRGKGNLPHEVSLLTVSGGVHVTTVKQAADGSGLIVRLFNPLDQPQDVTLAVGVPVSRAALCRMDESEMAPLGLKGGKVTFSAGAKKIVTVKLAT